MSVNFFSWIRDGVKQSVLLGVSDAIETIGTPEDPQTMHPSVAALLQGKSASASSQGGSTLPRMAQTDNHAKNRKRLGRSLKDIDIKPAG